MAILAQNTSVWTLRLLTALAGLGLVVGLEMFLRFMPGIGPAPLVVKRAERGDTTLYSINREYSERFFSGQQGRLAAAGQMAERFFVEPAPENLYRVVFVGASTVQGFPHPRRLAAASFLESMLQDAMPDRTVEVFNLGITSIARFAVAQVVKDALALEPDLVVVYTGHNEFYGIYGAEESARYNWLDYSLRQLHLAHLVQSAVGLLAKSAMPATDLLKLMAERGEVPLDDMRRERAKSHLRNNLREIGQLCREAGVPLALCTLAANETAFAPAGSSEPPLDAQLSGDWLNLVESAGEHLTRDYITREAAEEALALLDRADAQSGGHAWPTYLRGRALQRLGQDRAALKAFRAARDLDTMPWRAPSDHSEIIRAEAEQMGAVLVDVENELRTLAGEQGIGWQYMVDHVHFSTAGQILLARLILEGISDLMLSAEQQIALEQLDDDGDYRQRLGDVPVESVALHRKMAAMLSQEPMKRYNGHNARYLQQLMTMEWQRLTSAEQRGIQAWMQGGQKVPLALAVADLLFEAEDFSRAQQYYRASRLEGPFTHRADLWATVQWAWSIKMQDKPLAEADELFLRSSLERSAFLAQDSAADPAFIDYVQGQLHHLLGQGDLALVHLERAFLNEDFRRIYATSLFHALAAELVQARRLEDARRYAQLVGEESGRAQHYLNIDEGMDANP